MSAGAIRAGRAFIEFVLTDKGVSAGVDRIAKKMRAVGGSLQQFGAVGSAVFGAIGGTVAASARSFATAGASIDDMSRRTGFSAKTLGELSFAAEQSGASLGTIEKSVKGMEKFILGAAGGGAKFAETLNSIGVAGEQLAGLSPEEQFRILSEAIAGVDDPTQRAALAMKVFGKSGADLLPLLTEGPDGIAALRKQAQALGVVLSDEDVAAAAKLDDALNVLSLQFKMVFNRVGAAVAGPLTDFGKTIESCAATVIQFFKEHEALIATLAKWSTIGAAASIAIVGIGTAIKTVATAVKTLQAATVALKVVITALEAHPLVAMFLGIAAATTYLATKFSEAGDEKRKLDAILANGGGRGPEGSFTKWSPELSKQREAERRAAEQKPANADPKAKKPQSVIDGVIGAAKGAASSAWVSTQAAAMRARFEANPALVAGGRALEAAQHGKDVADELQQVTDETDRARIEAMKDGAAKDKARIALEQQIKERELQKRGLLTPEIKAQLDAAAQIASDAADKSNVMKGGKKKAESTLASSGSFSGAAAALLLQGGGVNDEILDVDKQMLAIMQRQDRRGGGGLIAGA